MARVSGRLVMTGNRDDEFAMNVEFSDATEAHPLRIRGYYLGNRTSAEMIEELTKRASTAMDESKPDVTENVGDGATGSGDEVRTVDSQSSTESLKVSTPGSSLMDTARVGDPPTGADFCRAEHSRKEEISLKEEDTINEEDTKKEEDSSKGKITCKEEDTAKQEDVKKEEDSSKGKITCKEEDTAKQEDVKKEEDSSAGEINLKEGYAIKEEDAKKEVNSLKGEFILKEEHAKKVEDSSEEEDTTEEEGSGKGVSAKEEGSGGEASGNELSGRSPSVVGLQPHLDSFPDKFVSGPLRPDLSSADEVEKEVEEVDDYFLFDEDVSTPVSLCLLPLELEEGKTIGGSGSTKVLSLHGTSVGVGIMRLISAWKLMFLENASFQILVKMAQNGDAKWVKLGEPRSRCKEKLEDVFLVAKVLALLKKEPQASEDRVWHHLLEGEVAPETLRDHLRMRCSLMEQFIDLDPILKEARKTLIALFEREKEANSGKRVLSDRDSSDEVENRPGKKFKTGNVVQKNEKLATMVGVTSYSIPEDVYMGEFDGEEEYYDEGEGDESDEEFGDSCCIFCDDGGILLCCDGPCMRSFHATIEAGIHSQCTTLGLTEAVVARLVGKWLCKNCKYKQHQCYVCGELGCASNEDLGARQEVFVCNVACCGRFYHPKCIANKLTVDPSAKETLAENIQAGKESFTCPLHVCNECREGENSEVSDLILVKCRRCPIAWHKKCLPRTILFDEEARKRNMDIRAWTFGEKKTQLICYCTDHKIIASLGTPSRKHLNFGLSPDEAKEKEEFEKQKKKVSAIMKEPARYGAKTSAMATSMGKSAGKKYRSTELIAKPRPDRLIGSSSVPPKSRMSKDAVKTCEEAAERTVDFIVTQSKLKLTEESVKMKHESNLPGIYKPKRSGFMKMGMVSSILEGAKAAVEKILLARHMEAMTICDKKTVQIVMHEEERLRTYLAPTLFGKRYTSYGRHFTKLQKLEKVVEILQPYIWDRDTIVDFSCGDNSFCQLFREALSEARKTNCQFKNFDIFPSKDAFGFEQKDWLQVGLKDCGPGENLVIGLNPPFAFVERFVSHALGMNPRLLVLIVPPMKKNLEHLGYECLVDDDSLMAEKSFYLPGSVNEKSMECLEQGNNVAPHFFIYCHKKFSGRYKGGVPVLPEGPSTANRSAIIRKIEMPAKLPPSSEPTANIFIPSVPPRPLSGQVPGKVAAPRNRDPRQYLGVSSGVSRPVGADALEEGELPSPQAHLPFRNNPRPVWLNNLPPPLFPHVHMRAVHPRHQPGPYPPPPPPPPFIPLHHYPGEYSPFDPGLFPRGSPYVRLPPPVRPSQNGFQRGPRQEEFFPGPSPSRHPEFLPEDDNGLGGWIG